MKILPRAWGINNFLKQKENADVNFPEHAGVVTDAHWEGKPVGRGKMVSATKTDSDINLVIGKVRKCNAVP